MDIISKTLLLKTIRKALETYLTDGLKLKIGSYESFPEEVLQTGRGVFVSIWRLPGPDIRASKGIIHSEKPLIETAIDVCIGAIKHDAIFPQLKNAGSLAKLLVQITLLDEPVEISGLGQLTVGDQALIISFQKHTGIFLPELIRLAKWDATEAVTQLCLKSGLPGNMWRDNRLKIFTATVDSFIETEPGGWDMMAFKDFINA